MSNDDGQDPFRLPGYLDDWEVRDRTEDLRVVRHRHDLPEVHREHCHPWAATTERLAAYPGGFDLVEALFAAEKVRLNGGGGRSLWFCKCMIRTTASNGSANWRRPITTAPQYRAPMCGDCHSEVSRSGACFCF